MSNDKGALTLRPYVFVGPNGLHYVGLHDGEDSCWRVALGWPSQEEIDLHKMHGFAVYPANVTWRTSTHQPTKEPKTGQKD